MRPLFKSLLSVAFFLKMYDWIIIFFACNCERKRLTINVFSFMKKEITFSLVIQPEFVYLFSNLGRNLKSKLFYSNGTIRVGLYGIWNWWNYSISFTDVWIYLLYRRCAMTIHLMWNYKSKYCIWLHCSEYFFGTHCQIVLNLRC